MSHEVNQNCQVAQSELAALKRAVAALGGVLVEGQTSYRCYQGELSCDHAIHVKGARAEVYEIGLRKNASGAFDLVCDFYGRGKRLGQLFGDGDGAGRGVRGNNWGQNLDRLKDRFAQEVAVDQLTEDGFSVTVRTLADGTIEVTGEQEDTVVVMEDL